MSELQAKKPLSKVAFLVILAYGNELNRTIFVIMYKIKDFRAKLVGAIFSTFHIFTFFIICFSWVYFFSAVLSSSRQKNNYKSLKSWKIDDIDLTQRFSLSIFTDFCYKTIKITWFLPIFIDSLLRVELIPANKTTILSPEPALPLSSRRTGDGRAG